MTPINFDKINELGIPNRIYYVIYKLPAHHVNHGLFNSFEIRNFDAVSSLRNPCGSNVTEAINDHQGILPPTPEPAPPPTTTR